MGPEQSADRMTIFNQALNNFEQHGSRQTMGPNDFGNFIERTWMHVQPAVALEAINKMLEEAKSKESPSHLSMSSEKGSINLNSTYELRLFQLLPVVEELDKDKAEALLRDNTETKARLTKYPKGMQSLTSEGNIYSYGVTDDDSPKAAEAVAGQEIQAQISKRLIEINNEAGKDPE